MSVILGSIQRDFKVVSGSTFKGAWTDRETGLVIAADARLDDRTSLLNKLGVFESTDFPLTSSKLILLAYQKWATECVKHLVGDFAFIILDPKNRVLYCARDHIGARPFYFSILPNNVVFASSALDVASHKLVKAPCDEGRIADSLLGSLEGINETSTFFKEVVRLPPAHWLLVTADNVVTRRYWGLSPDRELSLGSDEEYTDAMQAVLETAIRDRMPTSTPVTSMLSGGVDSSTIVGIARNIQHSAGLQPLKTISGVSEVGAQASSCRETKFVNSVIAQGGLDSTKICPESISAAREALLQSENSIEEPFDYGAIMHRLIYLHSYRVGGRVIFGGIDGDVVASLNTAYPAYLARDGQYRTAYYELMHEYKNYFRRSLSPAKAGRVLRQAFLPVPQVVRRMVSRRRNSLKTEGALKRSFLSPELADGVNLKARFAEYSAHSDLGLRESLRHEHISRIISADLTAGVERNKRIAGSMGVEVLHPLLDRRVIEFCVSLPWNQKCRDGWSKYALRKVGARFLPAEVAWRPGWEEIAGKFNWAYKILMAKQDARLLLEHGENLSHYIDWPKVRKYALSLLDDPTHYSAAGGRVVALINWQRNVSDRFRA